MTTIHPIMMPIKPASLKVACSSCNLRELCPPVGFSDQELQRLNTMVATRRSVFRGETLFRSGDPFEAVYAVRTGFFKTRVSLEDGRDQVTGFQMAGEVAGAGWHQHRSSQLRRGRAGRFTGLRDSLCAVGASVARVHRFAAAVPQDHAPRDRARPWGVMLLLGSMRAEARLAAFLLNLTQRLRARGFSPTSLVRRMTREEIGTYLGLKLETVSRCFSKFQEDGVLLVKQRQISILD